MLRKVLIVDDSPFIHKIYRVFLNRFRDCTIVQATNGKEALMRISREPDIDLILLDINMPIMNGLEFLESLKRDKRHSKIPVIIISTEGSEADTKRGLGLGAKGYIVKPFKAIELYAIIDVVFGNRAAGCP